jgi:hypothetical protein
VFTRSLAGAPPSDFWAATDSTLAPPGAWRWQGMTRLVFAPAGGWPDGVCRLRGRPELLRDPEGLALRDSVLSFSFRALAPSELGSVRGRVQGPGAAGAWVVARDPERPRPLQARAGEDGRFAFEGVCPGAYTISGYADLDGDGRHGPGRLSPYAPSEPYGRVPEPVAVARGGTTPDVELVFR